MGKNLKDVLLEAGYEPMGEMFHWPYENGKYVQALRAEEGDHVVMINELGEYIDEVRLDEEEMKYFDDKIGD